MSARDPKDEVGVDDGAGDLPRRRPWKRLLLLAAALLLLGGLFYTTTDDFLERVRALLVELVDTRIAGDFSIERIEGSPWRGVELVGVALRVEGEPVARIESIALEPVWRSLLRRRFRLARIIVESPRLTLRIAPDGPPSWARALARSGPEDDVPAAPGRSDAEIVIPAFIEAIAIRDGSARIETPDRPPFEIVDFDAELRIDSRSNRITIEEATARSAASRLEARGEIKPNESLRLVVEPLRIGSPDLGRLSDALAGLPEITGRLALEGPLREVAIDGALSAPAASAELSGQVDLVAPAARTTQIHARLESRSLAQTLPAADLAGEALASVDLDGDRGDFEATLRHPGGRLRASGTLDLRAGQQVEASLELSDFDPAAIRPSRPEWSGRLDGRGQLTLRSAAGAPLEGRARFSLAASRVGAVELEALTLEAHVRDPAFSIEKLDLVTRQGSASLTGSIDRRPTGPLALRGRFDAKELEPLLALAGLEGTGTLTGDVTLEGTRRRASVEGRLTSSALTLEAVALQDAELDFGLDVDLTKPRQMPRRSRIEASIGSLAAWEQRAAVHLALSSDDPEGPARPELSLEVTADALDDTLPDTLPDALPDALHEDEQPPSPVRRFVLDARGVVDDQQIEVVLRQAELELATRTWRLRDPAKLRLDPDTIEIESASMGNGTASIEIAGRLSRHGEQRFRLDARSLSTRVLADLFLRDFEPEGRVDVTLEVAGQADAPTIDARAESSNLELGFGGLAIDRVLLVLGVAAGSATLELSASEGDRMRLEASSRLPVELSWQGPLVARVRGPLDAEAHCGDLDLRLLRPLVSSSVEALEGQLRCAIRVVGPLEDLDPTGTIELVNVTARPRATGVLIREGSARLDLDRDRVVLRSLHAVARRDEASSASDDAKQPDAQLRAEGTWQHDGRIGQLVFRTPTPTSDGRLGSGAIEGRLTIERWPILDTRSYALSASGEITASGDIGSPRLQGSMRVDEGILRPTLDFLSQGPPSRDPTIHFEDMPAGPDAQPLQRAPATLVGGDRISLYESLALDLSVDLGRDLWIRHPEASVELAGTMRVRKRSEKALSLEGEIEADRGWFRLQGRRFNLIDGRVSFGGETPIDPRVDILARYKVPDYEVDARLQGPASSPTLTLTSDPPLEQPDILAVLIFGRPISELSEGEQESVGGTASSMAAKFGMTAAGRTLAKALGLDEAGFYIEEISQERAEIGTYLGRSTFVSVAQRFGIDTGQELTVEYEFWPGWSIVTSTSTDETSSIDLFWKIRY